MQYYLNGFRPGDPTDFRAMGESSQVPLVDLPETVDVLIVGCGPAGLVLAAQLAAFPEISTRIVEQKECPIMMGQADGISGRSLEIFQALGFADRVLDHQVNVAKSTMSVEEFVSMCRDVVGLQDIQQSAA